MALGLIAGVIWAAILFAGPVLDNLDVKNAIAEALNQRHASEEQLELYILNKVNGAPGVPNAVGSHFEVNALGEEVELPGLGLTTDNVFVDRNTVTGLQTITVDYTRTVVIKPLSQRVTLHFRPSKTGEIR